MFKDIVLIPVVRQIIAGICASAITWATSHGVDSFKLEVLIGVVAVALVNIAWAVGERAVRKFNLHVALDLPSGSEIADLKDAVDVVPTLAKIKAVATGQLPGGQS
jgi:hypothetical protein